MSSPNLIPTNSPSDAHTRPDTSSPLPWALYLGISWTWCIGMFLPVLLVRDMGTWGWFVFAVPNVVGAAAMGWVLRTRESSESIIRNHFPACYAFSLVTVCFHVFFLGWMIRRLLGDAAGLIVFAAFFVIWIAGKRNMCDLAAAAIVFILSAGAFASLLSRGDIAFRFQPTPIPSELLYLLPVCLLGFLLCPYLDLTFHLARQRTTDSGARAAFSIGFGLFFLLMILFSLAYAGTLAPLISTPPRPIRSTLLPKLIGLHIAIQSAFTLAVHIRQMESPTWSDTAFYRKLNSSTRSIVVVLAVAVSVTLATWANQRPKLFNLPTGEVVYRSFMGFYGLVFPAYVLTRIVPRTDRRRRAQWLCFTGCLLAALPFFFTGFILQKTVWLLPGVAIVLIFGLAANLLSKRITPREDAA